MKKLIKRADGSKSPRGLWDNIRANKGSGKKPTKEMLKQEAKIKKEENMNMEYKKGGKKNSAKAKVMKEAKREKESFITESKELKFGAPSTKYNDGGKLKTKTKEVSSDGNYKTVTKSTTSDTNNSTSEKTTRTALGVLRGVDKPKNKYYSSPGPKPEGGERMIDGEKEEKERYIELKKGGKKTMEPGGGGRFAKMVNKMKGQGKSEESAKAIAASIGRKKYGNSKFQAMAAAGKKKMGGKKC